MDEETFKHEMMKARTFIDLGERPEYWAGYSRGLRRRYHGENFGTDEEHELWMKAADSDYEQRRERGHGYRDGYNFQPAETEFDSDSPDTLSRRLAQVSSLPYEREIEGDGL